MVKFIFYKSLSKKMKSIAFKKNIVIVFIITSIICSCLTACSPSSQDIDGFLYKSDYHLYKDYYDSLDLSGKIYMMDQCEKKIIDEIKKNKESLLNKDYDYAQNSLSYVLKILSDFDYEEDSRMGKLCKNALEFRATYKKLEDTNYFKLQDALVQSIYISDRIKSQDEKSYLDEYYSTSYDYNEFGIYSTEDWEGVIESSEPLKKGAMEEVYLKKNGQTSVIDDSGFESTYNKYEIIPEEEVNTYLSSSQEIEKLTSELDNYMSKFLLISKVITIPSDTNTSNKAKENELINSNSTKEDSNTDYGEEESYIQGWDDDIKRIEDNMGDKTFVVSDVIMADPYSAGSISTSNELSFELLVYRNLDSDSLYFVSSLNGEDVFFVKSFTYTGANIYVTLEDFNGIESSLIFDTETQECTITSGGTTDTYVAIGY
ncbi:hypothetical protein [Aminipila terrae]|uniref:Uncharacterized protein n=1 Tax=Aminipila terrae TaxID=2697030 RepID=A0A6P1MEK4_9FIRM|nr:hypothetical protein [Aminipila terrae]QHI73080.1 hypothetical protein Ami3637_12320 [Aminipila terrae]